MIYIIQYHSNANLGLIQIHIQGPLHNVCIVLCEIFINEGNQSQALKCQCPVLQLLRYQAFQVLKIIYLLETIFKQMPFYQKKQKRTYNRLVQSLQLDAQFGEFSSSQHGVKNGKASAARVRIHLKNNIKIFDSKTTSICVLF